MTNVISLLGSTGSIGRQTLDVARQMGVRVCALTANRDVARMEEQARAFHPALAVLCDEAAAADLRTRLRDTDVKVLSGEDGLLEAASMPEADTVVTAVVGMVGLKPTLAAIRDGKRIALANKETLVCAGELVMREAARCGAEIVPVDSEHSAIFQCLQGCGDRGEVRRLILTCSGGPFWGKSLTELSGIRKADALKHPNWKMGAKITVDCATLMNKGLEVIEAMRLYGLPRSQVDVVIHRQSVIHSMVEFRDGAVLAQMGTPDMRLPIRYALTYPARGENPEPPLDLLTCPPLTFAAPDPKTFSCLRLAAEAADEGGTACAILNGANETAVSLFLQEKIGFLEIPELVARARETVPVRQNPNLEEILEADQFARDCVRAKHEGVCG
jgi:1-deoxy-D-xylulose-5-phosphate reductoisomerase